MQKPNSVPFTSKHNTRKALAYLVFVGLLDHNAQRHKTLWIWLVQLELFDADQQSGHAYNSVSQPDSVIWRSCGRWFDIVKLLIYNECEWRAAER